MNFNILGENYGKKQVESFFFGSKDQTSQLLSAMPLHRQILKSLGPVSVLSL